MTTPAIILWLVAIAACATSIYWLIVLFRAVHIVRNAPTVREGLSLPGPEEGWPKLSIVVPAHNEQRIIDDCAASLRALEYPNLEIIFVLDRCTDATAEIIAQHAGSDLRITVIHNDSCPPESSGKCNAVHIGARRATGEYLLFTDADTHFEAGLARAAVAIAMRDGLALFSLFSNLTFDRTFEWIAQPVATMLLARMFPIARVASGKRLRPVANGQFMLFERAWYERIGGHGAIHDVVGEDTELARRIDAAGGTIGVRLAAGMLIVRMYEDFAGFCNGWKRIYIETCSRRVKRLRKYALRLLVAGLLSPALQVGIASAGAAALRFEQSLVERDAAWSFVAIGVAGLALQFGTLMYVFMRGGAPWFSALAYPLGVWINASIMLEAASDLVNRVPLRWAGKEYVLEPR
jgi:chlorobactene glucosyltransferase